MSASEPSRPTRVALFGYGRVNAAVHQLVEDRAGLELAGVVRSHHSTAQAHQILAEAAPDVIVVATRTPLVDVARHILVAADHARHVLCTSEELAFQSVDDLPAELGEAIRAGRLTLVSAGLNPGWVFDSLPLAMAATMGRVTSVSCGRMVDISGFGPTVRRNLGIGVSVEVFDQDVDTGRIRGHVGFERSAHLLAATLGLGLTSFTKVITPILGHGPDAPVAGIRQVATARSGSDIVVDYDFVAHIEPESAGLEPSDWTVLRGAGGEQRVTLSPGLAPVPSTAALLVNAVGPVLALPAGVFSTADLLPLHPGRTGWTGRAG